MSGILILGCGQLVWRPGFAEKADVLSLGDGYRVGGIDVSLAGAIDRELAVLPSRSLIEEPRLKIDREEVTDPLVLPPWGDLVDDKISSLANDIQGPGTLVTPGLWSESALGRSFLRQWHLAGWVSAGLEWAVREQHDLVAEDRLVSSSGAWVRISESDHDLVTANGVEVAQAAQMAPRILREILLQADLALAQAWVDEEASKTRWFVEQRLVGMLRSALAERRPQVSLGGRLAPIFGFSTEEAQRRFADLASLRVEVSFSQHSAALWWQQLSEPGFLEHPTQHLSGFKVGWAARTTFLLEPGTDERRETRGLSRHLRFQGLPSGQVSLRQLSESQSLAWPRPTSESPDEDSARGEVAGPGAAQATPAEIATLEDPEDRSPDSSQPSGGDEERDLDPVDDSMMPADEVRSAKYEVQDLRSSFAPDRVDLVRGEITGRAVLWVDGVEVSGQSLLFEGASGERTALHLEGLPTDHHPIVRVDYEWEED